jgi:hypothetical protein
MKVLTRAGALGPAVKRIGQGLVLLGLLGLVGAGMIRSHSAPGQAGAQMAATNGQIHQGSQAATNGDIHISA